RTSQSGRPARPFTPSGSAGGVGAGPVPSPARHAHGAERESEPTRGAKTHARSERREYASWSGPAARIPAESPQSVDRAPGHGRRQEPRQTEFELQGQSRG